jgi:hypothetical protein
MASRVKPIPEGYHTATPYLIIRDAAGALEFYKKAFGATELYRMAGPGGKVMHAEIQIGDSRLMLADEFPEMGYRGPQALGGSPVGICLYVEDVDALAPGRPPPAPGCAGPCRISSTAIGRGPSRTPTDTSGPSPPTSRT